MKVNPMLRKIPSPSVGNTQLLPFKIFESDSCLQQTKDVCLFPIVMLLYHMAICLHTSWILGFNREHMPNKNKFRRGHPPVCSCQAFVSSEKLFLSAYSVSSLHALPLWKKTMGPPPPTLSMTNTLYAKSISFKIVKACGRRLAEADPSSFSTLHCSTNLLENCGHCWMWWAVARGSRWKEAGWKWGQRKFPWVGSNP